ncbi:MAG: PD-(D/E)XK nuclease family protein [Bacteroidia bacterium]|nr:PD-(D/E)XK nuclease family protein [Bacteroidia bacterium]
MTSFLEKVAAEILSGKYGKPEELCVVLPSRRAGLYLKKLLGTMHGRILLSPEIYAIEDLISELFPGRITGHSESLFLLYRSYLKITPSDPEAFDAFCRWAGTFLNDIQEIDNYLADADQLFGNLEGIRELEEWSLNREDLTQMQQSYLSFWKSLHRLYIQFRIDLESEGLAYRGMALRKLCESNTTLFRKNTLICGFNALNTAEATLFQYWQRQGLAVFFWDADIYYYSDPFHEAGKFLREHLPGLKPAAATPAWISDDLSAGKKEIYITGIPGNTLQAKYVGQLLENLSGADSLRTAVVLADESLLFPVLHALPGETQKVNISMGFPMKMSTIAGFIETLLRLHEQAERSARTDQKGHFLFYHREVLALMKQPAFLLLLDQPGQAGAVTDEIITKNKIFSSRDGILKHFTGKDRTLTESLLSMNEKAAVLATLEKVLEQGLERLEAMDSGTEQEFFFEARNIIGMIAEQDRKYDYFRELRTLVSFIRQAFRTASIPFYGEPLTGLQIMGVLETRALDFDRVILLSANEQILPSGRNANSFIPYDLRKYFGLPTYHDRDAIFSYHFYRLIQRAKEIHCLYTTIKDVIGSGEKSRFLTQLENELPGRNPNIKIYSGVLSVPPPKLSSHPILVEKDEAVLELLKKQLEKGISPSAINTYLACPLRYFLSRVAGLSEAGEVEETIDARSMGSVIHGAIEKLYLPLVGQSLSPPALEKMKIEAPGVLEREFLQLFSKEDLASGPNLLAWEAAQSYLEELIRNDIRQAEYALKAGIRFQLLAVEQKLNLQLEPGLRLSGVTDRIDLLGNTLRIIDYKTGKVDAKDVRTKDITSLTAEARKGMAVQLMSYALMHGLPEKGELLSGIYSFRSSKGGIKVLEVDGSQEISAEMLDEFKHLLKLHFRELLDPTVPFRQTEDKKTCEYCAFREVCGKD